MKTLNVPYVKDLEIMLYDELSAVMPQRGVRQTLENTPWKEFPYKPDVTFYAAASDTHLFVRFEICGEGLKAEFSETNDPVWQDSCVEVFIGDADGKGYRNFEINCIGALLSAHQKGRGVDVEPISEREAAKIIRHTSLAKKTFHEIDGMHRWDVTVGIPFEALGYATRPETLSANLYKCADGSKLPHYVSWSQIDTPSPDFHRPEFFGTLILEHPLNQRL